MDLETKLKAAGVDVVPEFTGNLIREKNAWFIGFQIEKDGHTIQIARFGNWSKGTNEKWASGLNGSGETPEIKKHLEALSERAREEKEKLWDEKAAACEIEFTSFTERGHSIYLARKQITELFGCRLEPNEAGDPILIVPLRDVDGKLWNLQKVYSVRLSAGDKFFTAGARIEGCFHIVYDSRENGVAGRLSQTISREPGRELGGQEQPLLSDKSARLDADPQPARGSRAVSPFVAVQEIYIAEGIATAAAVALALRGGLAGGDPSRLVVCAFNAGNLQAVAENIRGRAHSARIVICADNDAYTIISDKPVNVGIEKGRRAAGASKGELVYPVFKHPQKGLTDYNDLQCAEGLEVVRDQLLNPGKYVHDIQPMILDPKIKKVSEHAVAAHVLKYYGDNIVKCGEHLFKYNGLHWVEFEERDYDLLKLQLSVAGGKLSAKDTLGCYRVFLFTVPHVPMSVNLHQPNPNLANFQNGTLHLIVNGDVTFEPHDRENWCMSVLPHDCPALDAQAPPTPLFDAWTERLWPEPGKRAGNVSLVFELMGSCFAPCNPNITFFVGKSNSGKSTLVKLMVHLVNLRNTCQVQLCDMKGFALEAMVNKLVNFDTELELNRPIQDVMVKKIVDRSPFNIDRKFKKQVSGFLPAVHFFAANDLPPTLDGASQAYGRRIIVVKTDAPLKPGEATPNFERVLWEKEGAGLLIRALQGLRALHARDGAFTVPQGSAEMVREMETRSDLVEEFLDEVNENEIFAGHEFLALGENFEVPKQVLWEVFLKWMKDSNVLLNRQIGSGTFFRRMKLRFGTKQQFKGGTRLFLGIGPNGIRSQDKGVRSQEPF